MLSLRSAVGLVLAHCHVRASGPRCISGERHSLEHGVRVSFEQRAIDLCAGVRLEAVGDQIAHVGIGSGRDAPLRPWDSPRRPDHGVRHLPLFA